MVPAPPERNLRVAARDLVRGWLASGESEILRGIDTLGRQAVAIAAVTSGRLDRGASSTESAGLVLHELQALADAFVTPPPKRRLSWFSGRPEPEPRPIPSLDVLVENLDKERDKVARTLIAIDTDRAKLRQADVMLAEALQLIRACGIAMEAAAREMALAEPARTSFLREKGAARLLERERDILTQTAVTQQGILTLDLISDAQDALGRAIERARETSVAALRTMIAARRAVASGESLSQQTEALNRAVEAAHEASASRSSVEFALTDAVAQVRRAIDAAEARR